jgi:hypothetical protein
MQKNIELFNYSLSKPEEYFEDWYTKGVIIIPPTKDEKNDLTRANAQLIDTITAYQVMGGKLTPSQEADLVGSIVRLLFYTTNHMNYSAFSQYLMVCDLSYSLLESEPDERKHELIREVLREYVKDRHSMYQSHGYSDVVLQVLSDNYSHKRNARTGPEKAERQVLERGIPKFRKGTSYGGNYYLLVDEAESDFTSILKAKQIRFLWSTEKQLKIPDMLISFGGTVYIIEHKHKKEGGGGQSSQGVEAVDLVKFSEDNASFVTYMDGPYFNKLGKGGNNKESELTKDILKSLEQNKNNYFVNTAGFDKFLDEVVIDGNTKGPPTLFG